VAAGVLPFAFGVGTASADESYSQSFVRDHSFTRGDGAAVTCTFSGESNLRKAYGENLFRADALTRASGTNPACGITFVEAIATYVDGNGDRKTSGANSVDGDVQWFAADVAARFSVVHRARFDDCQANCQVSFTTSPK